MPPPKVQAKFVDPMLLLRTDKQPDRDGWIYELKLDGFRAVAFKTDGKVHFRSRNGKDFSAKYPAIAKALASMPDETVIDGEIVALEAGRPSFNTLQSHGAATGQIFFYVFDIMIAAGEDVMAQPLEIRREILRSSVLPQLADPIRESPVLEASLPDLICSVKAQRLEGLVAKRRDSRYEPGQRSGAWRKMRVNQRLDFVIAGYTPAPRNFDAVIIGHYEDDRLIYVDRTRNGFTPASREALFRRFEGLETALCPFANLPEAKSGRWGVGLTAEKMLACRWLVPVLVGNFEFLEITPDGHLRHSRFVGLREDKKSRDVGRE
jgi:bifunctional non-homologous end joining protein LigD